MPGRGKAELVARAAELLRASRRPILYVGHGAMISGAGKAVMALAEKLRAPIVNTLLGKGAADETHALHLGMLGMHGTAYANNAVAGAAFGFRYVPGKDHTTEPGNAAVEFVDNTLAGVWSGFLVQSNGKARLSGNTLTGVGAGAGPGVLVRAGSGVTLDDLAGANAVTGFAAGVLAEGSARVADATLTGNGATLRNPSALKPWICRKAPIRSRRR